MADKDQSRERFEEWLIFKGLYPWDGVGAFRDWQRRIASRWESWQAATSEERERAAQVCKRLAELTASGDAAQELLFAAEEIKRDVAGRLERAIKKVHK